MNIQREERERKREREREKRKRRKERRKGRETETRRIGPRELGGGYRGTGCIRRVPGIEPRVKGSTIKRQIINVLAIYFQFNYLRTTQSTVYLPDRAISRKATTLALYYNILDSLCFHASSVRGLISPCY